MSPQLYGIFPLSPEADLPPQNGIYEGVEWSPLSQGASWAPADNESSRILIADWDQVEPALQVAKDCKGIVAVIGLGIRPRDSLLIELLSLGMHGYVIVPRPKEELGLILRGILRSFS